jgi:hypothetical protein
MPLIEASYPDPGGLPHAAPGELSQGASTPMHTSPTPSSTREAAGAERAVSQGRVVPPGLLGELRDSTALLHSNTQLRQRLAEDGYLFLRGVLDAGPVLRARSEVFGRLAAVGEIADPPAAGIATGHSRRRETAGDLGAFWKSVNAGPALRQVTHGAALCDILSQIFGAPAIAFDFMFLRAAPVGRWTGLHFDHGFFTRATEQVLTAWIPLGDIPWSDGPLMVVEGSHRFEDLTATQRGFDVARDTGRRAAFTEHPVELASARRTRLLSAHFRPGDVLIFGMLTLHGTFDNCSPAKRVRLSCDVRFQPAAEPRDPRYFGPDPAGTTGAGWAELNGARPLDEPWHVR